jgi:hypothetical protein
VAAFLTASRAPTTLVFTPPEEAGENEWCPRCGRQTRIIIGWGNDQTS